jgi:UDP-glucose:(heptosyl)LPS alpha-1,3-glucosyltransferase
MVAEELKLYYGRTENVRVIFNGVEMPTPPAGQTRSQIRSAMRGRLGLADDEPVFLTIATNFDLKGVDHAIAALGELRRQTGRGVLLAVGSQASARLTGQVSTLGLADAVHFAPPAVDIFPWYAAADICVLLSWYDACSRVVLEACRLGIPSITTAFNGAAEALAGGAGIVVASPADIPSVVNAMRKMLDQATLTDLAGAAAGVGEQLSMARHVDELVKIYSQITETK